jgi:hypothetical protein
VALKWYVGHQPWFKPQYWASNWLTEWIDKRQINTGRTSRTIECKKKETKSNWISVC